MATMRYAAMAEIAGDRILIGDCWDHRYPPHTLTIEDTEDDARAVIRAFVAKDPTGRGSRYKRTWIEERPL